MPAETPVPIEQTQAEIDLIRGEIESLYATSIVKQAIVDHYEGRVGEYAYHQFQNEGIVTVPLGIFQFQFFPPTFPEEATHRNPSMPTPGEPLLTDGYKPTYRVNRYRLGKGEDGEPMREGARLVLAKPDGIDVTDITAHGEHQPFVGPEAIDLAKNVILTFYLNA